MVPASRLAQMSFCEEKTTKESHDKTCQSFKDMERLMDHAPISCPSGISMCSTCPTPQGIAHWRRVTNPATQSAECPAEYVTALGGSYLSTTTDLMDRIDKPRISNIPIAESLLVSDLENKEAMETCNVC
ncbi:hypothetical protein NPIL_98101 [Nephila pilipes]|uniref:Uncharacterized protein n=1 Tax=Nephila pilipes TaxID=299642 RepID=A0A8X6U485_NEPPI|nr:hypothetical protein NPIL_98101 [Nephila pilipes]